MKYLVDANVLSEPTRPEPRPAVVDWLRRHERALAVDPVILGEVRYGILLLPRGARRTRLERWFDEGVLRLHCIPWEAATGLRWAELLARLRAKGRPMPIKDSLIAATALTNHLTVATRNVPDFENAGCRVVDPFSLDQIEPASAAMSSRSFMRLAGAARGPKHTSQRKGFKR